MKYKSIVGKLLLTTMTVSILSTALPAKIAHADSFTSVTVGGNLSQEQKQQMLNKFGVSKDTANIMEVNKDEEIKYLGKVATKQQIGTKSISCSYVEPTTSGGIVVETNNLTWVTQDMIKNALITAGIEHAKVKADAPFPVSGTAALTGILKGFESSSSGQKIDENKKEAANEEIVVTGGLADKLTPSEASDEQKKQAKDEAASIMNEIKTEVIKDKPKDEKAVEKIVINITNNYNSTSNLSDKDIDKITKLMVKINKLELDYKSLKDQLDDVSKNFKATLDSQAKNFFQKIGDFFSNLWDSIKGFFSSKEKENATPDAEEPKPLLDENGNFHDANEKKEIETEKAPEANKTEATDKKNNASTSGTDKKNNADANKNTANTPATTPAAGETPTEEPAK